MGSGLSTRHCLEDLLSFRRFWETWTMRRWQETHRKLSALGFLLSRPGPQHCPIAMARVLSEASCLYFIRPSFSLCIIPYTQLNFYVTSGLTTSTSANVKSDAPPSLI